LGLSEHPAIFHKPRKLLNRFYWSWTFQNEHTRWGYSTAAHNTFCVSLQPVCSYYTMEALVCLAFPLSLKVHVHLPCLSMYYHRDPPDIEFMLSSYKRMQMKTTYIITFASRTALQINNSRIEVLSTSIY